MAGALKLPPINDNNRTFAVKAVKIRCKRFYTVGKHGYCKSKKNNSRAF